MLLILLCGEPVICVCTGHLTGQKPVKCQLCYNMFFIFVPFFKKSLKKWGKMGKMGKNGQKWAKNGQKMTENGQNNMVVLLRKMTILHIITYFWRPSMQIFLPFDNGFGASGTSPQPCFCTIFYPFFA